MIETLLPLRPDPWRTELIAVVRSSHTSGERRAISRDVACGILTRLGPGTYVPTVEYAAMTPEDQHVVRMRALAATAPGPVVFSHWSAAVLHGLPVLRARLDRLHVTVEDDDDRHRSGVAHHLFLLGESPPAASAASSQPMSDGPSSMSPAVLGWRRASWRPTGRCGPACRALLEQAVELAGPRRTGRRISDAIAIAHPGGESAAESRMRVTMLRIGVEPPVLQHRLVLRDGRSVYLDAWFEREDAALEADGDVKLLDPVMAKDGAANAYLAEKRRENEVRLLVRAFGRIGWRQTGDASLLRPALAAIGVRRPITRRITIEDYAEAARDALPRFGGPVPRWKG